jgi:subtilisin family serine protease
MEHGSIRGIAGWGACAAWTQSRGAGVIVAIIDSGVQVDHPDLVGSLWTNPAEIAGNGVDDDASGFVDDVHGANVVSGTGDLDDDLGHGTHVAGIVAARLRNHRGGAGIAPGAQIMPVKIFDRAHAATSTGLTTAIRYAVDAGARILTVSLNGDRDTAGMEGAIADAGEHGATIVASAGNDGRDIELTPSFPAASTAVAVLTVTASDRRGALLAAARPDLDEPALRDALRASGSRLGAVGAGRLNIGAAMHAVLPGSMWRTSAMRRAIARARSASR